MQVLVRHGVWQLAAPPSMLILAGTLIATLSCPLPLSSELATAGDRRSPVCNMHFPAPPPVSVVLPMRLASGIPCACATACSSPTSLHLADAQRRLYSTLRSRSLRQFTQNSKFLCTAQEHCQEPCTLTCARINWYARLYRAHCSIKHPAELQSLDDARRHSAVSKMQPSYLSLQWATGLTPTII